MNNTLLIDSDAEILQLHYYLKDKSHSVDAFAFNKAENELLKTIEEISKIFGVEILVESEALGEGGVRANYRFKEKKNSQTITKDIKAILIAVTSAVIGGYIVNELNKDPEMDAMNKEKTRLEILHLKNQIKGDLPNDDKNNDTLTKKQSLPITDSLNVDSVAQFIAEKNKIQIYRSNFYRAIKDDEKITKVSTIALDDNHKPVSNEKTVVREDFNTFIIDNTIIDDLYENNVKVEIIAPVLNGTSLKWKGVMQGNLITFSMKDKSFTNLIISKNIKFTNGTKLQCDLETKRKINKEGEIIFGAKSVYNVTEIKYPDGDRIDIRPA